MIRTHTCEQLLHFLHVTFTLLFCAYLRFIVIVLFHVSLCHFVVVLLAFLFGA